MALSTIVDWFDEVLGFAAIVSDDFARCREYHDRAALEQLVGDAQVALLGMALADAGAPADLLSPAALKRVLASTGSDDVLALSATLLKRRSTVAGKAARV